MILRYGGHRSQVGELTLPGGDGPWPVAVVIHGGCWRTRYDRRLMEPLCADLVARGWAAWNVEYRRVGLRGGGGWPMTFDDVQAAVACLAAAAESRLDLGRTVAIGHSAGGQLALWAAARGLVGAAVGQAAVSDLDEAARAGVCGGMPQRLLGGGPADVPDRYAAASPARLLPLPCPALLVHGDRDDVVPVAMSRAFAAAAGCDLDVADGCGHFEHLEPGSAAWATVVAWLDRL